ncbi:MAG: hypothetical protein RRY79_04020 [Clostridia bacterium]
MKKKLGKILSVITVAPVMAMIAVTLVYIFRPQLFDNNIGFLFVIIFCLGIVPLLAYPVARIIPKINAKGREGERNLAFLFTLIGYLFGIIYEICFLPPHAVAVILTSYFITALLLTFVNKVVKVKASGHACGMAGPIVLMVWFLGWPFIALFALLPIVYWARMAMDRHTVLELAAGTAVGIVAPIISLLIFTFFI